jgi:hypothetical protein
VDVHCLTSRLSTRTPTTTARRELSRSRRRCDAAEQCAKVFTKLADCPLEPKRILPTYKMLVQSAKLPLPSDPKALALEIAGSPKDWESLLKRSFHTFKADGSFIYERAAVTATVTDRLASLGDPPTRLQLELVRFRLERIDTGSKVVSARRILPGAIESKTAEHGMEPSTPNASIPSLRETRRSLGNRPESRCPRAVRRVQSRERARLAQRLERLLYTQDVGGSSPSSPT